MIPQTISPKTKAVAYWLLIGLAMIIVQTLIGGVTRLSGSGLSITEWDIVTGIKFPVNHEQWMEEFAKYKGTPQYLYLNVDFSLQDFQSIFFWEWFHRIWARLIGVVFAIPFVFFIIKGYFNRNMIMPLVALFLFGALQGMVGWIMVQSGLVGDAIYVRPTRLAIHFVLAMLLGCYVLWFALQLLVDNTEKVYNKWLRNAHILTLVVLVVQFVYGALMAGHRGATAAATWPTINGDWLPPNMLISPDGHPFLENKITIHFIHRGLAYLLTLIIIITSVRAFKLKKVSITFAKWRKWPLILVGTQVVLGVLTVLMSTHIIPNRWGIFETMAELHQMVAMFLMISIVMQVYLLQTEKG